MKYVEVSTSLKSKEFPALGEDLALWQDFADRWKNDPENAFFRRNFNSPEIWDATDEDLKSASFNYMAMLHGQTFRYRWVSPHFYSPAEVALGPGFHGMLAYNKNGGKRNVELDGDAAIPRAGMMTQLQCLFYSLAEQVLFSKVEKFLKSRKKDFEPPSYTGNIFDYNVMAMDDDDDDIYLKTMTRFSMPDQFAQWMEMPTNQYAFQAIRFMMQEITGTIQPVDADLINIMRSYFFAEQSAFLMRALEDDDPMIDEFPGYRTKWHERAQKYVLQAFTDGDRQHLLTAARIIGYLKNNFSYVVPPSIDNALMMDRELEALTIANRDEALEFGMKEMLLTSDMQGPVDPLPFSATMAYIAKLGPQRQLPEADREMCDLMARRYLSVWPLQPGFIAHYSKVMKQIAELLRGDPRINALGEQWRPVGRPRIDSPNFRFLRLLNHEVSGYMGMEPRPLLPFRLEPIRDPKPWDKNAAGFATTGESNPAALRREYNMRNAPTGIPFIGINTHPEIGLFQSETPMRAAKVVIHEIFHHESDHQKKRLRKGTMTPDDPRYSQVAEFSRLDMHQDVDRLLRDDFSRSVYPLIQTEKFQYWVMEEFEKAEPFSFLKS